MVMRIVAVMVFLFGSVCRIDQAGCAAESQSEIPSYQVCGSGMFFLPQVNGCRRAMGIRANDSNQREGFPVAQAVTWNSCSPASRVRISFSDSRCDA